MPRTRSLAWSELKIGLLTIAAITIAAIVIFMVGGQGGFFWQRYQLRTRFPDIRGLKEGAVVRLAGVEVGKVTELHFAGSDVEVVFEVSNDMRDKIRTESRASIGSISLLGQPVIDVSASTKGESIPPGGFVPAIRGTGQLSETVSEVADRASASLQEVTGLLRDVRGGKGTMGRLVTDEALYRELQRLVNAAGDVANNLNRGRGTAGRLLNDPRAYQALQTSLENLHAITARLNAGEGSLGRLLKDEAFAKSLQSTTSNLDTLTGRINRGEGTAGKLVTDAQLYNRLNSVAERLDQVTMKLNDGQGTAGQLLQDKRLYENMNTTLQEVRNLVEAIRKDPKKYLNVRVSIF